MAHLPHLLASCTRHRLTEAVAALWSGWRQLGEFLYRNHAEKLPEKVYLRQRIFKGPILDEMTTSPCVDEGGF